MNFSGQCTDLLRVSSSEEKGNKRDFGTHDGISMSAYCGDGWRTE
jgi:hypothetical protein